MHVSTLEYMILIHCFGPTKLHHKSIGQSGQDI